MEFLCLILLQKNLIFNICNFTSENFDSEKQRVAVVSFVCYTLANDVRFFFQFSVYSIWLNARFIYAHFKNENVPNKEKRSKTQKVFVFFGMWRFFTPLSLPVPICTNSNRQIVILFASLIHFSWMLNWSWLFRCLCK